MLVSKSEVGRVLERFLNPGFYALDTETTGLEAYKDDHMFSLILSDSQGAYYFNFIHYDGVDPSFVLSPGDIRSQLQAALDVPGSTWVMHNAKFDMSMLAREGLEIKGEIHDTMVGGRIEFNRHFSYSLDNLTKQIGEKKLDEVEECIKKQKLYSTETTKLGNERKKPRYDLVPFDMITRYGLSDANITRKLAKHQIKAIDKLAEKIHTPNIKPSTVFEHEKRLTKTLFDMEKVGIKINEAYCMEAYEVERNKMREAQAKFKETTGHDLVDSGKALAKAFEEVGLFYPKTEKGNPCFNDGVLKNLDCELAQTIRDYRAAHKKNKTYYANLIELADDSGVIHPGFRQSGTDTGRMSCGSPNLQNVPKEDTSAYPVRRAFVPREDFCFVMIDFSQQEYRLMLDYANEEKIIKKIMNDGLDVHEATAEMMGVDRTRAKTLNFMILYGGGIAKLAGMLDITEPEAKKLRTKYFRDLARVKKWKYSVQAAAEVRGYVHNWLGRVCHFDKGYEYKAPNHLIQGGCADITKIAMNSCHEYLKGKRSRMLLQIHDEILFEVHKNELDIVEPLKILMEESYPHDYLPMSCSVEHSWDSWQDKIDGAPV